MLLCVDSHGVDDERGWTRSARSKPEEALLVKPGGPWIPSGKYHRSSIIQDPSLLSRPRNRAIPATLWHLSVVASFDPWYCSFMGGEIDGLLYPRNVSSVARLWWHTPRLRCSLPCAMPAPRIWCPPLDARSVTRMSWYIFGTFRSGTGCSFPAGNQVASEQRRRAGIPDTPTVPS